MSRPVATVLVVEDDRSSREVVGLVLRGEGFRALEAASVAEALDLLAREMVLHVLVTDLHLPDGSGLTLAREVRARFARARVSFVSGALEAPSEEEGRFRRKPISLDELLDVVRSEIEELSPGPPA